MRKSRLAWFFVALLLVAAVAARHPTASIQILTHQANDPAPQRVQAGFDLGVVAFSLLITWTSRHFS